MPGTAAAGYFVTTLSLGSASGVAGLPGVPFSDGTSGTAASNRTKSLRSIRAPPPGRACRRPTLPPASGGGQGAAAAASAATDRARSRRAGRARTPRRPPRVAAAAAVASALDEYAEHRAGDASFLRNVINLIMTIESSFYWFRNQFYDSELIMYRVLGPLAACPRDITNHVDHTCVPSQQRRAHDRAQPPRRLRARGHGGPDRAPRGVRRAPAVRGRGLLLSVQVLHGGPSPVRRCRLQPDQGGAGRPPISRHRRTARKRRAQPHDRPSPGAPPDAREPRGAPGRRFGKGQAGRRGAAGVPIPAARRSRARAQGPEPAGRAGGRCLVDSHAPPNAVVPRQWDANRSRLRLRLRLRSSLEARRRPFCPCPRSTRAV